MLLTSFLAVPLYDFLRVSVPPDPRNPKCLLIT